MVCTRGIPATILLFLSNLTDARWLPTELKFGLPINVHDNFYQLSSNDVPSFEYISTKHKLKPHVKKPQALNIDIPLDKSCLLQTSQPQVSPTNNLFYIGDLEFSVPDRTDKGLLKRRVLAECGFLHGLADFKGLPPNAKLQEEQNDLSGTTDIWFQWNRLKLKCMISTVIDGLKDGTGEASVLVQPLYMLTQLPSRGLSPATMVFDIDSTTVQEAKVTLEGLDSLAKESRVAIGSEIESQVVCIVNRDVRKVLEGAIKGRLLDGSLSKTYKSVYRV